MSEWWIAAGLLAAGWFAIRWAEESQRMDDLCRFELVDRDDRKGGEE